MTKEQMQVREFMLKAGQECPERPTIPEYDIFQLRLKLIREETDELEEADLGADEDLPRIADALGDLMVVVLGTAVAYGIDMEPIFQEIHRSNMTKFIDGYKREDGKWIKGPSYSPAELGPIIEEQRK